MQRGTSLGQPAHALHLRALLWRKDEGIYSSDEELCDEEGAATQQSAAVIGGPLQLSLCGEPLTLCVLSDVAAARYEKERLAGSDAKAE